PKLIVLVPALNSVFVSVNQQHESYAALDQTACQKALAAERFGYGIIQAIQLADVVRLPGNIDEIGRLALHPEGELVGGDARLQIVVGSLLRGVPLVHPLKKVELAPHLLAAEAGRRRKVQDRRSISPQRRPLIGGRQ